MDDLEPQTADHENQLPVGDGPHMANDARTEELLYQMFCDCLDAEGVEALDGLDIECPDEARHLVQSARERACMRTHLVIDDRDVTASFMLIPMVFRSNAPVPPPIRIMPMMAKLIQESAHAFIKGWPHCTIVVTDTLCSLEMVSHLTPEKLHQMLRHIATSIDTNRLFPEPPTLISTEWWKPGELGDDYHAGPDFASMHDAASLLFLNYRFLPVIVFGGDVSVGEQLNCQGWRDALSAILDQDSVLNDSEPASHSPGNAFVPESRMRMAMFMNVRAQGIFPFSEAIKLVRKSVIMEAVKDKAAEISTLAQAQDEQPSATLEYEPETMRLRVRLAMVDGEAQLNFMMPPGVESCVFVNEMKHALEAEGFGPVRVKFVDGMISPVSIVNDGAHLRVH